MKQTTREIALAYHSQGSAGNIAIHAKKPIETPDELSLAYSPGVAEPCKAIAENPEAVYQYTSKGNLVAVISDGTAVLGLGNIGPAASKPVMEGKSILFKKFAGVDAFDIEVDVKTPEDFIRVVKALEPTFGGINLEDIKAPQCFEIEEALRRQMNIPVMHDDQHGTAIIAGAALVNALEIANKQLENIKIVMSGAGAGAIATAKLFVSLGVSKDHIVMFDSKGMIHQSRPSLEPHKAEFATKHNYNSLSEALQEADAFVGFSGAANTVSQSDVQAMAQNPIVFALSNPNPEIPYDLAVAARPDAIVATGRMDCPNQANNVLGYPYIFRAALDVRATTINEAMKHAAVKALAALAKEPVPADIYEIYGGKPITFGREYLIPKAFDTRLMNTVTVAVAQAAIASGVAKKPIQDWDKYRTELQQRMQER